MNESKDRLRNFEAIPLPLDPDIKIKGIVPEKVNVFKSALLPMLITFVTEDDAEYSVRAVTSN